MTNILVHVYYELEIGKIGPAKILHPNGEYVDVIAKVIREATKEEFEKFAAPHGYEQEKKSLATFFYELEIKD